MENSVLEISTFVTVIQLSVKNRGGSAGAGLQKKRWNKLQKSAFSGKLDMQSAHACAVQTHFFVFALRPEK